MTYEYLQVDQTFMGHTIEEVSNSLLFKFLYEKKSNVKQLFCVFVSLT